MSLGHVDDDDLALDIDLGRGQSDAWSGIPGFEHVVDQSADLVVDLLDGPRLLAQSRVGKSEDIEYGHANS